MRSPGRRRRSSACRSSARRCRPCAPSSRCSESTPRPTRSSEAGSARRLKERVRDLDIIATASDPAALTEYLTKLTWVEEVAAKGKTKADGRLERGPALRPACRAPRLVRQPAPALHRARSSTTSRCARTPSAGSCRSPSTASRTPRPARCSPIAARRRSTSGSATRGSRPSCARTWASWRPRARGRLPQLVELADMRGDLHSHSTWSSDGRNTIEEMALEARRLGPLLPRGHRPLALPSRRSAGGAEPGAGQAVQERLGRFKLVRGIEVNIRANGRARRRRRRARRARLGDGLGAFGVRQGPDGARAGRDGEPARRLHRPPDGPQAEPPGACRRRSGARSSKRPWRRARSWRSTPSPTASTCATRTRGWRARPASRSPSPAMRTRSARSRTSSSASRRPGVRGSGPDQILNTRPWGEVKRLLKRS